MDCYRCLVEGLRERPEHAVVAIDGTPLCSDCATASDDERRRVAAEVDGWIETSRLAFSGA